MSTCRAPVNWGGARALGRRQRHLRLKGCPKYSSLSGHRPAPDRVRPTREPPPYQGARTPGSTSLVRAIARACRTANDGGADSISAETRIHRMQCGRNSIQVVMTSCAEGPPPSKKPRYGEDCGHANNNTSRLCLPWLAWEWLAATVESNCCDTMEPFALAHFWGVSSC